VKVEQIGSEQHAKACVDKSGDKGRIDGAGDARGSKRELARGRLMLTKGIVSKKSCLVTKITTIDKVLEKD
jgi:hypothetical protein